MGNAALAVGLTVALLGGCCSAGKCLEKYSGPNQERVKAQQARRMVVINDSVSGPDRDRTDWWYTILTKPGKLKVQLHWDNGKARLELAVYDMMGAKIQDGRVWGTGGLRALVAVEDRGRYFIRVRSKTGEDESPYSLRLIFKPDRPKQSCSDCTEGARKCQGDGAYTECHKIGPSCMDWSKPVACPASVPCKDGMCGNCKVSCTQGGRRCAGGKAYKICVMMDGCPSWTEPKSCSSKKRCRGGKCVKRGRVVRQPRPRPTPPRPTPSTKVLKAKVISIYKYRGRMTLHIEIGDNPAVKPGQTGTVLNGNTGQPLPGGAIKISRVSGRYAIATTSLEKLGKNRWVKINTR